MKLAIVHDYLNQYGGAERVIEVLSEVFPKAPIYTTIYVPENLPQSFKRMDIRTSFMQYLPFLKRHFKKYLLLYPKAIESLNLKGYDLVLSSSSAFAKGANIPSGCYHICYCYTPMRFVWHYEKYIESERIRKPILKILPFFINQLKRWDLATNSKVNFFIAISKNVQKRIWEFYKRESEVIYPPVQTKNFTVSDKIDNYFLVVSRLNGYKNIGLVIEAFNKLNLPLRIIGDGPNRKSLELLAKPNIKFLGKVPEDVLSENYSHCQAVIFPGEEDFGIVPLECQASGRPVIAYAKGGALETVVEGKTGLFFYKPTISCLIDAIDRFQNLKNRFDSNVIREHALQFDKEIFKKKIRQFIEQKYEIFKKRRI
ncbi:MAG: glycosyltransferase [Candidatus Omnitrophica bacterium]|nr:glycosyltransferase [Candidatus Omnitrophota bacterium]